MIFISLSYHHNERKHYEWIRNPSPLIIMWNLYKHLHWLQYRFWLLLLFLLWNFSFVSQKSNVYKQRKYYLNFPVRISRYLAKLWGSEFLFFFFNSVNSNVSSCFFLFVCFLWMECRDGYIQLEVSEWTLPGPSVGDVTDEGVGASCQPPFVCKDTTRQS